MANVSDGPVSTAPFAIHIWPLGIGFVVGGLLGVFGNVMIVVALMKSKTLRRNRCNKLVGNLAVLDFVTCASIALCGCQAIHQSVNPEPITNQFCYYIRLPSIISYNAGAFLVLAIGVDRLVALSWPMQYRRLSKTYMIAAVAASWLFGAVIAVVGFLFKDPNVIIRACAMPTALRGPALKVWNYSNIVVNILVIACYFLAYRKAKSLAAVQSTNNDQILRNNRLLTSLLICVVIYMIGWMLTMLVVSLVNALSTTPSTAFHVSMYVGLLAAINVGCNFYVYYIRSDEYRRVFRKIMRAKGNEVSAFRLSPATAFKGHRPSISHPYQTGSRQYKLSENNCRD